MIFEDGLLNIREIEKRYTPISLRNFTMIPFTNIEMDHMDATEGWMLPPDLDILFMVLSGTRVSQGEKAMECGKFTYKLT